MKKKNVESNYLAIIFPGNYQLAGNYIGIVDSSIRRYSYCVFFLLLIKILQCCRIGFPHTEPTVRIFKCLGGHALIVPIFVRSTTIAMIFSNWTLLIIHCTMYRRMYSSMNVRWKNCTYPRIGYGLFIKVKYFIQIN